MTFAFHREGGLTLVVTTLSNVSPFYLHHLLSSFSRLVQDFCGDFSEETLRTHSPLIYEIVDEFIDFGWAQYSYSGEIRPMLSHGVQGGDLSSLRLLFNPAVSEQKHRDMPIAKGKAEVFLDVQEKMYMLFSASGYVLNSGLAGSIRLKSFLPHLSSLTLHLSPELAVDQPAKGALAKLDDMNFHECVDTSLFDKNRSLSVKAP